MPGFRPPRRSRNIAADGTENQTVSPDSRTNSDRPEQLAGFRAADAGAALPGGEQVECGEVEREVEQLRQPVRLVQVVARRDRVEERGDVRLANEHAFRATRAARREQQVGGSLRTAGWKRDFPF